MLFCVAGSGYTYKGEFIECILFRLKAVVLSAHRMVRTESSRRWICKLQRAKFLQCKFVTIGDEVFVVATKVIKIGEEDFVHYKI